MNLRLPLGKDKLFPNKYRIIFTQFSQWHIRPLGSAMVLIGKVVLCTLPGRDNLSFAHYEGIRGKCEQLYSLVPLAMD